MLPREHYTAHGPHGLGDIELLALILGTGSRGRSARAIATDLLDRFGGLHGLAHTEPDRMAREVPGVGLARAVRIHAAVQAGRRSVQRRTLPDSIRSPSASAAIFQDVLAGRAVEELHGLYLDRALRPLARRCLSIGSDGLTIVDPRQVFRPAVGLGANYVIIAHNHPSGDPTPSAMDREVTRRVRRAGEVLDIHLIDHIVIGHHAWTSLAEEGLLDPSVRWPDAPTTGTDRAAARR